jgi:putative CocE/NonD family hydrolase
MEQRSPATGQSLAEQVAGVLWDQDRASQTLGMELIDVRPDGFAQVLARGIIRGRYRDSLLEPSLLEPGKVYAVTVDLGPVAATLAAGHRLRVDVSGADYPLYDRNPNTAAGIFGTETAVATQKVHHGPEDWSRLVLPVK